MIGTFKNHFFIHVTTNDIISFFVWPNNIPLCICTTSSFFFYSSVSRCLSCPHVFAIVKSAAVNIGMHVCFWIMTFSGYMPGSGTAGSYGNSTFSFVVLGEVSETENDRYQMISLIRNLRKWHNWTYLQNSNRLTGIEKEFMVTKGEREGIEG